MENNIRNFCIIAHIDHGKSTLADRFLDITNTVEKRKMREQFLDQMELEREKGITIKMQPVRMSYNFSGVSYQLNLIDTPGHIDFSYEVSRSLKAVEGAVLLVDATQGVQAQTVSNLEMARSLGLVIIPVLNKIDSPQARTTEIKKEIVDILGCSNEDILEVSAKTGENTENLLEEIIKRIPPPKLTEKSLRGLVFDFAYSVHKGVILYVRIFDGAIKKGDNVFLCQSNINFICGEVGVFTPAQLKTDELEEGQIGYVMTNIKEAGIASVGDTLMLKNSTLSPLDGYKQPLPVAWASIYPESQDDFAILKESLKRLNLSDSALSFEEEESGILGRGFRCGFLGMLHLEIITERIRREFSLNIVVAMPSVVYKVYTNKGEEKDIYSPALFPEFHEIKRILEPWADLEIITPYDGLSAIIQILKKKDSIVGETSDFGSSRVIVKAQITLREMMEGFFEELKSISSGYASYNYEVIDSRDADLVRLDVVLNDELVPAFSKIVKRSDMEREAQKTAKKLSDYLPRALFVIKVQVKAQGRILAAQKISALKKDVTGYLYGGDITRKQKLWKKQKRGKEKLKKFGKVNIPHSVFIKMVKGVD